MPLATISAKELQQLCSVGAERGVLGYCMKHAAKITVQVDFRRNKNGHSDARSVWLLIFQANGTQQKGGITGSCVKSLKGAPSLSKTFDYGSMSAMR